MKSQARWNKIYQKKLRKQQEREQQKREQQKRLTAGKLISQNNKTIQGEYNTMNKNISNLITKLALECAKEGLSLSLCVASDNDKVSIAQVGSKQSIEKSINAQVANWFELLEECGCEGCQAKLAEYGSDDDDEEEMITDVFSTLADKLEEFLKENTTRGDF